MTVQPDLCETCSETTLFVFPRGGSFVCFSCYCPCQQFISYVRMEAKYALFTGYIKQKGLSRCLDSGFIFEITVTNKTFSKSLETSSKYFLSKFKEFNCYLVQSSCHIKLLLEPCHEKQTNNFLPMPKQRVTQISCAVTAQLISAFVFAERIV